MNGRKVAEEALRMRPDLRVMFTTGYTRNAIVHHGRLDDDIDLITKPFTATGLAERIREMLA
jgi:DNA-binding LytR/AlgR family response regulator